MSVKNLNSRFFDCCEVKGDKITIHKCVIDKAIKDIHRYADPYEPVDREYGQRDVMDDLLYVIERARCIENGRRLKKMFQ